MWSKHSYITLPQSALIFTAMVPLFIICVTFLLIARIWLCVGWRRAQKSMLKAPEGERLPAVSIVIAARNEEENLHAFLPSILAQVHAPSEVVVALDRCTDASESVLRKFAESYPQLRWVVISETPVEWAPKKWALAQAIETAQHAFLLCTDADCWVEQNWVQAYREAFSQHADLVLGLGLYEEKDGLLNGLIQYETLNTALQYIGAAGRGKPYMGVGRNMGYSRAAYEHVGGFHSFRSSLSGDDDLLVQALREKAEVSLLIAKGTRTFSIPKTDGRSWLRQKGRHFSASARYADGVKVALGFFHLSHILIYVLLALILVTGKMTFAPIFCYLGYLLGSWYIFGLIAMKVQQRKLIFRFPLLDFLYTLYHSITAPIGLLTPPSWQTNPKSPKIP